MALHAYTLKLLKQATEAVSWEDACSWRAAMFSCHDLIVDRDTTLAQLFGLGVKNLPYRKDSKDILAWHNAKDITSGVVDTHEFFNWMGWSLDCFDVVQARGLEIIKDLNEPFGENYKGYYDVVYDNVLGQVFMVGQSMRSSMELLREGGYLLSVSAANSPNHGFWSVSPTMYHDVLTQNGFEIVSYDIGVDLMRRPKMCDFVMTTGCVLPHNAANVVLAKRVKMQPFRFPTQSKFSKSPNSKG